MNDRLALLGRLAAGVAHDLREYLAVADASLGIVQWHLKGAEPREELMHARNAMESAMLLGNALVEYARGGTLASTAVELPAVVRRVLDLFRSTIGRGIEIALQCDADVPPIHGVPVELEQLVLNLVVNARDAMPNGGELALSVRTIGVTAVCIEVADTGGPHDADASASGEWIAGDRSRNGLGLAMVRAIAERHGAMLHVDPTHGRGTRVAVTFPVAARRSSS